jgi:hypothetical protein
MSHEIRTPISGIIGMADLMLLVKTSLTPECASYAEAIRSSGHALIALIDEILDLSKIEAGRFDICGRTGRSQAARRRRGRAAGAQGAKQGARDRSLDQPRRAAIRSGRRHAPQAGPDQPRRQCDQVHRRRRRLRFDWPRRGRGAAFRGHRHRPGVPMDRRAAIFEDFDARNP